MIKDRETSLMEGMELGKQMGIKEGILEGMKEGLQAGEAKGISIGKTLGKIEVLLEMGKSKEEIIHQLKISEETYNNCLKISNVGA